MIDENVSEGPKLKTKETEGGFKRASNSNNNSVPSGLKLSRNDSFETQEKNK